MKKVLFCILTSVSGVAQTQGVPTGVRVSPSPDVPAIVNERFRQEFPNVNSTWIKTDDKNFEASFWNDSTKLPGQVVYTSTGELVRKRGKVPKGFYPMAIDQHFLTNHPVSDYAVWREDKPDADTLYLGILAADTFWFGKGGNYLHEKNRLRGRTLLSEKDRAYLVDICLGNIERISMLSHVNDSNKVLSKEVLAGRYSQFDQLVRRFGAAKNIPLAEPMLPVGRIREPSPKDFSRMDKRLMKTLQKTKKKASDKELKDLARHLITLENRFASQGAGAR